MDIKHESSYLVIFNYLNPVMFLCIFWLLFKVNFKMGFSSMPLIILIWCMFLILFVYGIKRSIKTRYIIATDKNILIKNINRYKVLEYKDIISINESSIKSVIISIKYKDSITGKNYSIFTIPRNNYKSYSYKNKSDMFNYIQERMNLINQTVI